MKKHYENPIAEKITFDYREQVVATSGNDGDQSFERTIFSDECNTQNLQALGYDICSHFPF